MSSPLIQPEKFQHILRVLNTNIDGRRKVGYALTAIKGVGRRFAHVCVRKADVDLNKRAGELSDEEVERIITIISNPRQYKIPDWFLNRQKDVKDGKFSQVTSNNVDTKVREDLERLKKIRAHRGLRHYWNLRVRGQHTKTTGRHFFQMTQFLPPNLLALFAPRDPVTYLPPVDKLPHEKKRLPYSGMSDFINKFESADETPAPTRIETKEERIERRRREKAEQVAYKLEQDLALWDPNSNEQATSDPYKTLFIARINYDTSEAKLKREFEVYGKIKNIRIVHNSENEKPRGYAFIEYEKENDMHTAYKRADGRKIDGRRVVVDVERGRTVKGWRPRRLGGGLGSTRRGGPSDRSNPNRSSTPQHRNVRDREHRSRSRSRDKKRRSRSRDRHRRSSSREHKRRRSRSRSHGESRPPRRTSRDRGDRDRRRSDRRTDRTDRGDNEINGNGNSYNSNVDTFGVEDEY
ncbi:unnamed protein product [Didymodactylos carnosus]|uniref:Small ribosomal subunit protein uS13 n=1 Tax=Didymodactylos carnosus TaxID=1234261 RepID=A0A814BW46_9BILA|nr:unnamed protein product [Didymodactylos carnosus]CAF0931918.1 unnamed protein product [Didymodactylos carnosus]CAF3697191.1 unnamed protein product [Didymodactylos carnosus]CAF3709759.1 unnamed protein product [Didymodactylos carnosus]